MALAAPYNTKFGTIDAYFLVAAYKVDRLSHRVYVWLAIFKDAETRKAHKAASEAEAAAMAEVVELSKDMNAKRKAFDVLGEADKVKANPQLNVDLANASFKISQLNTEMEKQRATAAANQWGDVREVDIPSGLIPIDDAGGIELKAVYEYLAANAVQGAEKA